MSITSAPVRVDINTGKDSTTMDAFSSADAEESTGGKPNFIGRITRSEPEDSEDGIKEEYKDEGKAYFDFLYEIEVLDKEWKNQLQYGVEMSNNFRSKWMLLVGHLENIHGPLAENDITGPDDLAEALEGSVYEFREITWQEDEEFTWEHSPNKKTLKFSEMFSNSENPPAELIVPVRKLSEEEVDELDGTDSDEEVEEVEL